MSVELQQGFFFLFCVFLCSGGSGRLQKLTLKTLGFQGGLWCLMVLKLFTLSNRSALKETFNTCELKKIKYNYIDYISVYLQLCSKK